MPCYTKPENRGRDSIVWKEKSILTGYTVTRRNGYAVFRSHARRGRYSIQQSRAVVFGVCWNWITENRLSHSVSAACAVGFRQEQRCSPIYTCQTSFEAAYIKAKENRCVSPGLNCYSCPAASGACPIGSFQAVVGSSKFGFSYYITGFLILLGVLLGRFICGFLCPFGWLQELLHKIPSKKLSTKKLKPLTYLKYIILLLAVVLLPALAVNDVGMGDPFFCKLHISAGCAGGCNSAVPCE